MPWNRNDPDPLAARRRQLANQERLLSEQRKRLTEELHQSLAPSAKPLEPPVWRMEEDDMHKRVPEPTSARNRNLGRQRQSDMVLVIIFIGVLLVVLLVLVWVAYVRNTAPVIGT